jgi:hypothetical protein
VTVLTLIIVSANVANLMLGRAVERQRDTERWQALGASRFRIVRMLFRRPRHRLGCVDRRLAHRLRTGRADV